MQVRMQTNSEGLLPRCRDAGALRGRLADASARVWAPGRRAHVVSERVRWTDNQPCHALSLQATIAANAATLVYGVDDKFRGGAVETLLRAITPVLNPGGRRIRRRLLEP